MTVENITGSSDENDLQIAWPQDDDYFSEGPAHIRLLKILFQNLFADGKANAAVSADDAALLGGKALSAMFLAEPSDVLATDLNTVTTNIIQRWNSSTTNKPSPSDGICFSFIASGQRIGQLGIGSDGKVYFRIKDVVGNTWTTWATATDPTGTALNVSSLSVGGTEVIQSDRDVNANRILIEGEEIIDPNGDIDWNHLKNKPTIGDITGANTTTREETVGSGNINTITYYVEENANQIRLVRRTTQSNCNCDCACTA